MVSISFVDGVKKTKVNLPKGKEEEKQVYFRSQLAKIYAQKEDLILSKYDSTKADLAASLLKHRSNPDVIKNQAEIL